MRWCNNDIDKCPCMRAMICKPTMYPVHNNNWEHHCYQRLCNNNYEDEKSLQKSIEDNTGLAWQYDQVEEARMVTLWYGNHGATERALQLALKQGMIGDVNAGVSCEHRGRVCVFLSWRASDCPAGSTTDEWDGGRRTFNPEQFVVCKRVPKNPSSGTPRSYAMKIANKQAVLTLIKMLGKLMRLEEWYKRWQNCLHSTLSSHGIMGGDRSPHSQGKKVIMANNLNEYGVIDSKRKEKLPVYSS